MLRLSLCAWWRHWLLVLVRVSVFVTIETRAAIKVVVIIVNGANISISWQIFDLFIGYACSFVMEFDSRSLKIERKSLIATLGIIVVDKCMTTTIWKLVELNHTL